MQSETTPFIPQKSVETQKAVDHVNFNDTEINPEDIIQVHRSFHGIQTGLLNDYDGDRYCSFTFFNVLAYVNNSLIVIVVTSILEILVVHKGLQKVKMERAMLY